MNHFTSCIAASLQKYTPHLLQHPGLQFHQKTLRKQELYKFANEGNHLKSNSEINSFVQTNDLTCPICVKEGITLFTINVKLN